ncbi:hypothetical protein MTO96_036961 [Rhipicephalus appendiculatus]
MSSRLSRTRPKEGEQGTEKQPAPAEVQENGEIESEPAEALPTVSQKPAPRADNSLQAPGEAEVQKGREGELELAETLPSTSEKASRRDATSPSCSQPDAAALPPPPHRQVAGPAVADANAAGVAQGKRQLHGNDQVPGRRPVARRVTPEYKRHAVTAEDGDSLSTIVEEPEMEQSRGSCSFCGREGCDCSELSDASYTSPPDSPLVGESVA